jgi:hypothetical protein
MPRYPYAANVTYPYDVDIDRVHTRHVGRALPLLLRP